MNHFDDLVAGVRELRPIGADDELPRSANAGVGPSQPNPHADLIERYFRPFPCRATSSGCSISAWGSSELLKAARDANSENPELRALAESGLSAR